MIDRRSAAIARSGSPGAVQAAISFARERDLLFSIRAGGHNIAGLGLCDGEAYGPNYARLAQVKARHDPLNVFRVNQNIAPAPTPDA